MSDQIKFGAELPERLHREMQVQKAMRGMKLKDVYEQAISVWIRDADGAALDLITAFYEGPAGIQKELRSVLSEYRKQQQKAPQADEGSKPGSERPQRSGRHSKTA